MKIYANPNYEYVLKILCFQTIVCFELSKKYFYFVNWFIHSKAFCFFTYLFLVIPRTEIWLCLTLFCYYLDRLHSIKNLFLSRPFLEFEKLKMYVTNIIFSEKSFCLRQFEKPLERIWYIIFMRQHLIIYLYLTNVWNLVLLVKNMETLFISLNNFCYSICVWKNTLMQKNSTFLLYALFWKILLSQSNWRFIEFVPLLLT